MDFLKELTTSVSEQIRERLANPLLGAFLISWFSWNFRFVLVVLGNESAQNKIQFIERHLYGENYSTLLTGILYPFVCALAFVLIYPFANRYIVTFYRTQQRDTANKLIEIDKEAVLTKEQRDRLLQRVHAKEQDYKNEISELKERIADLEGVLRATSAQIEAQPGAVVTLGDGWATERETERGKAEKDSDAPWKQASNSDLAVSNVLRSQWDHLSQAEALQSLADLPRISLKGSHFELVSHSTEQSLMQKGLTGEELATLYTLRTRPKSLEMIESEISRPRYVVENVLTRLKMIQLIHDTVDERISLTSGGQEVLIRALERLNLSLR